ncbi:MULTISPECIES: hypothetical protein [Paraburkholderia]|uniref:hypothetical protein n=1 Tax=Paraburkholderia TaxID=1822464 RepID=UPI00039E63B9|nr:MULTISPECIES: hypothetical protein [Paraburkholderia]MDH6152378.1 hypothetical protein [Paraburkholderia sp. WSM4179]
MSRASGESGRQAPNTDVRNSVQQQLSALSNVGPDGHFGQDHAQQPLYYAEDGLWASTST